MTFTHLERFGMLKAGIRVHTVGILRKCMFEFYAPVALQTASSVPVHTRQQRNMEFLLLTSASTEVKACNP